MEVELKGRAMELLGLLQEGHPVQKIRNKLEELTHQQSEWLRNRIRLGDSGELLFHAATRLGDVDVMKVVMPEGYRNIVDVRTVAGGINRYTALHIAAANGRLSACHWLLMNTEPVKIDGLLDDDGNSPLHLAVLFRHKEVADLLVQKGASLSLLNKDQMTPISYCQSSGMFETLMKSPESSSKDAAEGALGINLDATNRTVLHYAAIYSRNMTLLKNLIQLCRPQDLTHHAKDRPNLEGTFLHEAARVGNVDALKAAYENFQTLELLKKLLCGENEENNPDVCHSPAMDALFNDRTEFFDAIMQMASQHEFTLNITLNSIVERLKKDSLIKEPDRVIEMNEQQQAAGDVHLEALNAANHQSNYAAENGHKQYLAEIEPNTFNEPKPLSSIMAESSYTVDLFASVLPTYLALYANKKEVFYFLLESGIVNVNQWDDRFGRTCLHWAVLHNRLDVVTILLSLNRKPAPVQSFPTEEDGWNPTAVISTTIKDLDGKTAFEYVIFDDNDDEIMDLILRENSAFKAHEERMFKDREVYVQGLNAILVGAAVLVGLTFAGWLQMPSNEFDSASMKIFYISNTVTFALAIIAICVTVHGLIPTPSKYVGAIRDQLRRHIVFAALLLATSVATAAFAFTSAGFASLNGVDGNVISGGAVLHSMYKIVTILMVILGSIPFLLFLLHLYQCAVAVGKDIVKRRSFHEFIRRKLHRHRRSKTFRGYRNRLFPNLNSNIRRVPLVHKLRYCRCEEEELFSVYHRRFTSAMKTKHMSILFFPARNASHQESS